jgi:hypothetical protein
VGQLTRPFALEQVAAIDTSVGSLEQAMATKDWEAMQDQANLASNALTRLGVGPAITTLTSGKEPQSAEELRANLKAASAGIVEAQQAIRDKDAGRLETTLQKFRHAYGPIREAAKRPVQ